MVLTVQPAQLVPLAQLDQRGLVADQLDPLDLRGLRDLRVRQDLPARPAQAVQREQQVLLVPQVQPDPRDPLARRAQPDLRARLAQPDPLGLPGQPDPQVQLDPLV